MSKGEKGGRERRERKDGEKEGSEEEKEVRGKERR